MSHRRQRGFTITELMVGIAVFSVILVVTVAIFQRFSGVANKLRKNVFTDQTFSGFSQRFVADVMNADVGLHFLNLPVRFSCSDEKLPCVRKLEADGKLSAVSAISGIPSIQFYRDELGALENLAAYTEASKIRIVRNKPAPLPQSMLSSQWYVTWPLTEDKNNPFVMMTRKLDSSVYFTFPKPFSESQPDASMGQETIVEASTPNVDPKKVAGSLMVVFNSAEPLQYFVQVFDEVLACEEKQGTKSVCERLAQMFTSNHGLDLLSGRYFKVRFKPLPSLASFAPKNVVATGQWWSQPVSEYLFPMRAMSIRDPLGHPGPDPRRVLHFFDQEGIDSARLMALPVQLQAFSLQAGPKNTISVVRRDFFPARAVVVLRDLPQKTQVVIGRKLGTKDITVFKTKVTEKK